AQYDSPRPAIPVRTPLAPPSPAETPHAYRPIPADSPPLPRRPLDRLDPHHPPRVPPHLQRDHEVPETTGRRRGLRPPRLAHPPRTPPGLPRAHLRPAL